MSSMHYSQGLSYCYPEDRSNKSEWHFLVCGKKWYSGLPVDIEVTDVSKRVGKQVVQELSNDHFLSPTTSGYKENDVDKAA